MLCNRRHGNYQPYFSISSDLYGNKQHINLWWVRFYQLPSMFYHVIWRLRDALSYVSNGNYIWWSKTCRFKKKKISLKGVYYITLTFSPGGQFRCIPGVYHAGLYNWIFLEIFSKIDTFLEDLVAWVSTAKNPLSEYARKNICTR